VVIHGRAAGQDCGETGWAGDVGRKARPTFGLWAELFERSGRRCRTGEV